MSDILSLVKSGGPIRRGTTGNRAFNVQYALISHGYKLAADGVFGGGTETAVEDFQRRHNLDVDGVVGRKTAEEIDVTLRPKSNSTFPRLNPDVPAARPLWLIEAMRWNGTKEAPGSRDNPVIIEWAHEIGGPIARDYTHDSIPWCALFQNMTLHKVGQPGTGTLWALDFAKYGIKLRGPAVGAIASMKRNGGGHVITVIGRDRLGHIVGIGGNQSDAVSIRSFPADRIESYNWPADVSPPARVGSSRLDLSALPVVNSSGVSINEA